MKAETYEARLNNKGYVALKKIFWGYKSKVTRSKANGVCFICHAKHDEKELQAGHFYHSKKFCMMDDDYNIQASCIRCNNPRMLSGNLAEYSYQLIQKYGANVITKLHDKMQTKELWNKTFKRHIIMRILAIREQANAIVT